MPVLVFCCFWFQKSYTGNILGIGRNKSPRPYFPRKVPEHRRGARGQPRGPHPTWRRGQGGAPPYGVAPPGPLRGCPSAYKASPSRNPKNISHDTTKGTQPPPSRSQDSGDRSLCSGTPPGRGIAPGIHLHRHHHHHHRRCCLL